MTNSYKKESPLAGFAGFGGGAPGLSYKSAATKIYVDEVFSTQAYIGNESNRTITNGLDLSTEGGLVWSKSRTGSSAMLHLLYDTERGVTKDISSQSNGTEGTSTTMVTAFNTDGYNLGTSGYTNENDSKFASWSFRKSEGFFDVIKYTGNGTSQSISHSLGSVPGMILIKRLDGSASDWKVYHRETGKTKYLELNNSDAAADDTSSYVWNDTAPTATHFTLGLHDAVNYNSNTYIAYVFAGGASDAATARSVDFDGNDYLSIPVNNSDFDWAADGSLTIEAFVNMDSITGQTYNSIINRWGGSGTYSFGLDVKSNGNLFFYRGNGSTISTHESSGVTIDRAQWYHIAVVKDGTTGRFFINGQSCGTFSWNEAFTNSTSIPLHLGNLSDGNSYAIDGKISNARFVNGTALYTSSFRAPTEPLTNITNTKLLCCNNSSTTGSTVTPGTITANGDPTASTDSPFDDSEGFKFGDGGEGIIKCGGYKGNGGSAGPIIDLGWEPQWVMVKNQDSTGNWFMFDCMRGIITDGYDAKLHANESNNEENDHNWLDLNATGFQIKSTNSNVNADHNPYIYVAIRRTDGWVSKPASAGTDVFAMDVGNASTTIPSIDSGFPVDFAFVKQFAGTSDWDTSARLISEFFVKTNTTANQAASTGYTFDSNVGWGSASWLDSAVQGWMWKRGKGFDVVTYDGDGSWGRQIRHSMNQVPEMMWVKQRAVNGEEWMVYHKGLDGGTAPETHYIMLHSDAAEADGDGTWNDTAPTSTHFTLGGWTSVNYSGQPVIAFLFSSVTGISKVGSYSGTGSQLTVTTGFQPRFIIIKSTSSGRNWLVFDTLRGWAAGNDAELNLNKSDGQNTSYDFGAPTATGFTAEAVNADINASGHTYIYYAHA